MGKIPAEIFFRYERVRAKYWRCYTGAELEDMITKEPITPERMHSLIRKDNIKILITFHEGKCDSYDGGGSASFIGIRDGLPTYFIKITTGSYSKEEQKETLLHELIHVYYRTGNGLHDPHGEEVNKLIQKETLRVLKQYPGFVNDLFESYKRNTEKSNHS